MKGGNRPGWRQQDRVTSRGLYLVRKAGSREQPQARHAAKSVVDHQLDVLYLRQKALATTKTCCLIVSRLIEQSSEMNR
jgi:hypothetical protein